MRTVPGYAAAAPADARAGRSRTRRAPLTPAGRESSRIFCEKHSPRLPVGARAGAHRAAAGAVFLSAGADQVANEGCATFCHYEIMTRLHETGQINNGALLEFLHSHSSVILQPAWADERFSGWNPYALGFAIMRDVAARRGRAGRRRIESGSRRSPATATLGHVARCLGELSRREADPAVHGTEGDARLPHGPPCRPIGRIRVRIDDIHDEEGYRRVASLLADQVRAVELAPLIEAADVRSVRQPHAEAGARLASGRAARRGTREEDAAAHAGTVGLSGVLAGARGGDRARADGIRLRVTLLRAPPSR